MHLITEKVKGGIEVHLSSFESSKYKPISQAVCIIVLWQKRFTIPSRISE